jgi:hypothetical protein
MGEKRGFLKMQGWMLCFDGAFGRNRKIVIRDDDP